MNYYDFANHSEHSIIARWIQIMRNPIYGFMAETTWRQENYKGRLMYVVCTPDLCAIL